MQGTLARCSVALVLLAAAAAGGPGPRAQLVQDSWREVAAPAGSARTVAAGGRNAVGAIDATGTVYRRDAVSGAWQSIGRGMARLAVDAAGNFWATDAQGALQRLEGATWRALGAGAVALAAAPDGRIVVATNSGTLARYDPATSAWIALAGSGTRVAVDARGLVWAVNAEGGIARRLGDAWIGLPGRASDIAADALGNVVIAAPDGKVYEWLENELRWNEVAGAARAASVAVADGQLWRTDADGKLYARGIRYVGPSPVATAPADPVSRARRLSRTPESTSVPDPSPPEFLLVATATNLLDLSIGYDGSVYGTPAGGGMVRWSNAQRRFLAFPGAVTRFEVSESGLPLGTNGSRALLRHDGTAWRRLPAPHPLVGIANAGDTLTFAISADGQLYRLEIKDETVTTTRVAGNVEQAAAAPDGGFWYRNTAGLLFQCDRQAQCERRPLGTVDFAIGPGGTLFAVDTAGNLQRFDRATGGFDLLRRSSVARVAVGPNDRPWIVEKNGNVLAARLFERDESGDPALARAAEPTAGITQPEVAVAPPVSSVTAYSFLPVDVPTAAGSFGNIGAGLLDITVGLDDQIIATGFDGPANANPCNVRSNGWRGRNWIYSPQQRRFLHLDFLKRVQYQLALAGRELTRGTAPPQVAGAPAIPAFHGFLRACENYHHVEYDAETYAGNAEFFSAGGFSIGSSSLKTNALTANTRNITLVLDADITLDGHVLAIFPERKINVVPLGANYGLADFQRYEREKFARVGVGATRFDIWATNFDGDVFQFVRATNRFEKRNLFVNDRAQDIGVGKDGSVFIVDLAGRLKKWDAAQRAFVYAGLVGVTRVAVTSKGKPVAANFPSSQRVFIAQ